MTELKEQLQMGGYEEQNNINFFAKEFKKGGSYDEFNKFKFMNNTNKKLIEKIINANKGSFTGLVDNVFNSITQYTDFMNDIKKWATKR